MVTLLDGAMGTELQRRGFRTDLPLWSARALIEDPDAARRIHLDYCDAGAQVLTTNTFRTHRRSLEKAGMGDRARELTLLAVSLAKEAAGSAEQEIRVAGSISPLEDCYMPDLSPGRADDEFEEIANWLAEGGCDLILIETMNNIAEMRSAIRGAQRLDIEFWVSVNPSNEDAASLLSGESLREAMNVSLGEGSSSFLVNCAAIPVIEEAVGLICGESKIKFGAYANNGTPDDRSGWRFDREVSPPEFAEHCFRLSEMGAQIIGGCCGTTPEHIKAAFERLGASPAT